MVSILFYMLSSNHGFNIVLHGSNHGFNIVLHVKQ